MLLHVGDLLTQWHLILACLSPPPVRQGLWSQTQGAPDGENVTHIGDDGNSGLRQQLSKQNDASVSDPGSRVECPAAAFGGVSNASVDLSDDQRPYR